MAASIRFLVLRTCNYLAKPSNYGLNCCTQARSIYLCRRNINPDRLSCLRADQSTWDAIKPRRYSSSSTDHVLSTTTTSSSTPDQINEVLDKNEEINEEELDCLYSKVVIEVKGHDPEVINSYEKFVSMAAEGLGVKIGTIFTPPKVITRYTLLKSVHIFKKHRVQYENRTHYRVIEFMQLTGSTADTILEYIQRNLPEGMAMKVTKYRLEKLPQHIEMEINKQ